PPSTPGLTSITPTMIAGGSAVPTGATISTTAGSTFGSALELSQTVTPTNPQQSYSYLVAPANTANATYFNIHSPVTTTGQTENMIVSVANLTGIGSFQITVFDGSGNLVTAQVLSQATGGTVVQVNNVASDSNYTIQVSSTATFNFTVDY